MAYEDRNYYGGTRLFIFENAEEMRKAIQTAEVYKDEDLPAFIIDKSWYLVDDKGNPIPTVATGGKRVFQIGDIVSMYEGKEMKLRDKQGQIIQSVLKSFHVISVFGKVNTVLVGITSKNKKNKEGKGIASLINDDSIDVSESLKLSRIVGSPVIQKRATAFHNVEFVTFVLRHEFNELESGGPPLTNVRIAAVAIRPIPEGSELSAAYGDSYWNKFLQSKLNQLSKTRSNLRDNFMELTRVSNAIQCRTK